MIKHVAKTGSNSNTGESRAEAYLTITYAISQMPVGGLIYVHPGSYNERVVCVSNLKLVANTNEGRVILDGSGFTAAVEIMGCHHVLVEGFEVTNNGATVSGWSVPNGIAIRDLNNTPGIGNNSHDITIKGCTFRDILRKNDAPGNGAQPLVINCFSDERQEHEACYNIQILDCRFEAGKHNMVGSGLGIGQLCPTGNVRDFLIDGCTFYWDMSLYGEPSTGIECVANYEAFYSTYPDIPRRGVISNNTFEWVGDLSPPNQTYAVYAQCQDTLIENNTIVRWGYGYGCVTEEGTNPNNFATERIWIRNNTISECTNYSVVIGTWLDTYLVVSDIWVTGNVIHKPDVGASEFPPITFIARNNGNGFSGSCRVLGNLIASPGSLILIEEEHQGMFGQNTYYTDSATPVRYPDYFTEVDWPWDLTSYGDIVQAYTEPQDTRYGCIPPWYTEGMFGEYNPVIVPPAPQGVTPRPRRRKYYFLND